MNDIPDWLFIDAVRYAMGRKSAQVSTTCDWLVDNWSSLPLTARCVIKDDLGRELDRDNRCPGTLGHDCDRRQWARVWNHILAEEWQLEGETNDGLV